jgi:hypothetical protein
VPSPNAADATGSTLKSVTAISSDNAWAVGSAIIGGRSRALTMHWDGRRWTIVPGNTPDGDAGLLGVLATWTHNIWAVGIINPSTCGHGGPNCQTLIEHWNSKRWEVLPSPNPPSGYLHLLWAASATSRGNIWAVGTTDYGSTLIVHWNGAAWSYPVALTARQSFRVRLDPCPRLPGPHGRSGQPRGRPAGCEIEPFQAAASGSRSRSGPDHRP